MAVAEELHFGRAANRLMIAQPPLSRQIRQLEDQIGARLLDRDRRTVALTPAGHGFLKRARRLLAGAEEAAEEARRLARGEAGVLRVGFVGTAIFGEALPAALRRFREAAPGVSVRLQVMTTRQQASALLAGDLDCGYLRPPLPEDAAGGIRLRRVERHPLLVAVPELDALADRSRVDLADLAQRPMVTFPREQGPGMWSLIAGAVRRAVEDPAWEPTIAQEAADMTTVVGLVAADVGCAIVPWETARLAPRGVAFRPLARKRGRRAPELSLSLAWPRDATPHGLLMPAKEAGDERLTRL